MPAVVITPEAFWKKPGPFVDLLVNAGYEIRYPDHAMFARGGGGEEEAIKTHAGAVGVIAGGEHFTARVQRELPDLKVIARCGVGYDRVDVAAATEMGKVLTITPNSNHEAVAEQAFALILGVTKRVAEGDRLVRAGGWTSQLTKPIRGRTLGLIGLGRIGRSTAVRGVALGMKVVAHELYPDRDFVEKHGIELLEVDDLLARSDFVSLHCPLNEETRGMVNADFLAKMQPGSTLINTARGGLVKETDLVASLESGHLYGAGLDVFESEPPEPDNPLFAFDNVVLSPHLAGTDEMSMAGMLTEAAQSIIDLLKGEWPEGSIVNRDVKDRFQSSL